ncbi:GrpB family protein [Deinococcus sp. Arct2-2]|nr:GrpB family protein [Deinococcus sp. Arct2-2]
MTLGLKRGTVALRPSSAEYPALFGEERARVRQSLGALALDIQHVGSTSIPGLAGKPILDLAVGVQHTE